jgi:hypothetical protein
MELILLLSAALLAGILWGRWRARKAATPASKMVIDAQAKDPPQGD